MIFIYLILAISCLRKAKKKLNKTAKKNISFMIVLAILLMVGYELYVEYSVGWRYGVPFDDDTGWIFRAAAAMKNGQPWNELYKVALNYEWNDSRVLSLTTLGQYIYAAFVSSALYYPVIIDIRLNLYLLYLFQIIIVSAAIVDFMYAIKIYMMNNLALRYASDTCYFFMLLFYPVVLFNSFKLLRETFFVFFMLKVFVAFVQFKNDKKYNQLCIYSICLLIIRPNSIVYVFPLIVCCIFNEKIATMACYLISFLLLFSSWIVSKVTQLLGWNYGVGTVKFQEMMHLLLFPSPISQTMNFIEIGKNPSWITLLYFSQSIWNIPIIALAIVGIYCSVKKKKNTFWILIWANALMVYSLAYSISNITPRYKLIYLIPQMLFVYIGLCQVRKVFHHRNVRMRRDKTV